MSNFNIGTNQYAFRRKNPLKPEAQRDAWMLLFFMALIIFLGREWTIHHPVVSPCSASGCLVTEVEAKEITKSIQLTRKNEEMKKQIASTKTPTVSNVMSYIGKKFGKYGARIAAKANQCFVTEGMTSHVGNEEIVNTRNVNYNCRYGDNFTSCKPGDDKKAWSVDCGVAQINVAGQVCPEYLFDFEKNIDVALTKFESRGNNFSAWYGTGCK